MAKKATPLPVKKKIGLAAKVTSSIPKPRPPLWKGPMVDGVSQSLLCRFLVCRDRFRVHTIEGLEANDRFNHRLEYGNMWHVCEEAHAANLSITDRENKLMQYCQELQQRYKTSGEDILKYYNICKLQYPIYADYWSKHPDVKDRTPFFQEVSFKIPFLLPSGRVVFLRGKFDSVDLIGKGKTAAIYLQENKSKGDIDPVAMLKQLKYDMQTLFYLTALHLLNDYMEGEAPREIERQLEDIQPDEHLMGPLVGWNGKIAGVRYNVIRRPLAGGRHSIKQKQGQTLSGYYTELRDRIAGDTDYFFMRWKVDFTKEEVLRFQRQTLIPMLEQLCDWYTSVTGGNVYDSPIGHNYQNYLMPYGVYSPLSEGYTTDVDEYIFTGSMTGLTRMKTLFPELE